MSKRKGTTMVLKGPLAKAFLDAIQNPPDPVLVRMIEAETSVEELTAKISEQEKDMRLYVERAEKRVAQLEAGYDELRTVCNRQQRHIRNLKATIRTAMNNELVLGNLELVNGAESTWHILNDAPEE